MLDLGIVEVLDNLLGYFNIVKKLWRIRNIC